MENQTNLLARADRARDLADAVLSQLARDTLLALEREFREQSASPPQPEDRMS